MIRNEGGSERTVSVLEVLGNLLLIVAPAMFVTVLVHVLVHHLRAFGGGVL
jgi:hypothetical protein